MEGRSQALTPTHEESWLRPWNVTQTFHNIHVSIDEITSSFIQRIMSENQNNYE